MKQKFLKQILGIVLSFGLVLGCATPITAAELPVDEQQLQEVSEQKGEALSLDDLNKTATVLTLNKAAEGVLEKSGEADYYKFTIQKTGYFKLNFVVGSSANPSNIGNGWNIEIYKESDLKTPVKTASNITAAYEFPKLAMETGNYYIKVYGVASVGAVGCPYAVKVDFTESAVWEKEENDEKAKANVITPSTTYFGNLYKKDDMDWFKVVVKEEGAIQLSFHIDENLSSEPVGNGWNVVIYNSKNEAIRTYEGIKNDFKGQKLPFSKGTYYVKVYANSSLNAPVDCTYELKLSSVKGNWESEYNDLKTDADTIKVNTTYNGVLYTEADTDYYKVTITQNGYFKVKFTLDETVNQEDIQNGWNVTIYDRNLKEIISYTGLQESLTSGVLPYDRGTYYIKVTANSKLSAPVDCIYKLKVVETKSSVWESEQNDERKTADTISLNKTYKANLLDGADKDWFKFTTKATGRIKLTLKLADANAADNVANGWDVYVYEKSDSLPIKELTGIVNKGSITLDLKKGTYYVKVLPNSRYYPPEQCTYSIRVDYSKKPGKVTFSSITAGKKQATLKWKKVSNADGYIIYRSTSKNGKYTKVATIKKNTTVKYTDKKLKSGKRYYYKVVAYNKTGSVTAYSADSKIKSVKIK
ncbi:MAG: fibronectin type III domain-containing protein [Agathobacter sp.]|nr:fibronectin type III domain-containing protein [Agathobacter sp.]